MKDILVKDIVRVCNGKLLIGNENDICESFERDTRNIKNGDTFIGIKGENFDGNMFYEKALKNGAKTCILQDICIKEEVLQKYSDRNIILVEDSLISLGKIAKYKRDLFDIPVIGITGSVGKTSTKDIIASVVSQKYNVLKTQGNLNNNIGLPFTILNLKEEHQALVVEMGMNHKGELLYLSKIASPTISVITNVGTSHIGNLGSRENILKAKLEILEGLKSGGIFIYNNDNDMLYANKELYKNYETLNFGIENKSDLMAYDINIDTLRSEFKVSVNAEEYKISVPVSGKHFVYNSLCAICVGLKLNINMQDIIKGINEFVLTKNRMEVNNYKNNIVVINDSYNASYDSMKASLEFLGSFKEKYKVAILGDMLELGEFSESLHFKLGKSVYENNIDLLITVGKYSKEISKGAIESGINKNSVICFNENDEALKYIKEKMTSNMVILLKASNSMNFKYINDKLAETLK